MQRQTLNNENMISEREEYQFKDGGTLVLTNGEDGVTVEICIGKPMMGTYTDMKKLAMDIGKYIMECRPEIFKEDVFGSNVQQQDKELYRIAIRLRRINREFTWQDYTRWLWGRE